LSEWTLPDWFTIIGFPLGIGALGIAIWQAAAAKSKAELARRAVERTEQRLADNHMLILVPRLEQVARDLDAAADEGNRERALQLIADWRGTAGRVRRLVERRNGGGTEFLKQLQLASARATPAKDALTEGNVNPLQATRHLRATIDDVCSEAAAIVGEMLAFTERETDGLN
jgi:hypothetical protein